MLAALEPADWPSAKHPFDLLMSFCVNPRPKVRKKAHDGLLRVLASIRSTAALAPASAVVLSGKPAYMHAKSWYSHVYPVVAGHAEKDKNVSGRPLCCLQYARRYCLDLKQYFQVPLPI